MKKCSTEIKCKKTVLIGINLTIRKFLDGFSYICIYTRIYSFNSAETGNEIPIKLSRNVEVCWDKLLVSLLKFKSSLISMKGK